jgi:AcrB/AcrD/AcrF family protein
LPRSCCDPKKNPEARSPSSLKPLTKYGKSSILFENNVYAQIGLVMLIGLAAKNAILIIEFSKAEYEKGTPIAPIEEAGASQPLGATEY